MGAKLHWTRSNSRSQAQIQSRGNTLQWLFALIFLLISLFVNLQARAESPGCHEVQLLLRLSQLSESEENSSQLLQLKQSLCEKTVHSDTSVKYENGQIATYWLGTNEAEWFYPNGRIAFKSFKKGSTLYYPNGKVATDWSHAKGVPWYHANGKILSRAVGLEGSPVFGPNGESMKLLSGDFGEGKNSSDFNMIEFIHWVHLNLRMSSFQASL